MKLIRKIIDKYRLWFGDFKIISLMSLYMFISILQNGAGTKFYEDLFILMLAAVIIPPLSIMVDIFLER